MKTKVNKIPLVGPRGRQEILKKIEQIAQQDYIEIELVQQLDDTLDAFSEDIIDKLTNIAVRGSLFDVILKEPGADGAISRIISYSYNDAGAFKIVAYSMKDDRPYIYELW